jgi:CDGSH-type Zn-finger protein
MPEPRIAQRSPFVLKMEPGTYWWCACGGSKNQPFCDGSHKGTGFTPVKTEITEAKMVAWCGCKHTHGPPFCDGTHSTL